MKKCLVDYSCIKGNKVYITGEKYNHLAKALRAKVGDIISVATPDQIVRECIIEKIDSDTITLITKETREDFVEPKTSITLYQAILKYDKTELVIQKAVELGVKEIVLFTSQFTQVKPNESKTDRLNKIIQEACQQSGRAYIPTISFKSYDEVLDEIKNYDLTILPYENEENKSLSDLTIQNGKNVAIIIGSAGGFSEDEILKARENNAKIVTLGKRILRAETASIVTIGNVMLLAGEMK